MAKVKILTQEEISTALNDAPGWSYHDNKISKQFSFNNFMDSFTFISRLAPIFEAHDHHPDIHIMYSKILFELQRHDIGGRVTDLDMEIAHVINEQYEKYKPHNDMI